MKIIEKYWNTETNEKSTRVNDFEWDDEEGVIYMFKDGNYSCDCNRSLFMYDWEQELECSESEPIIKVNIYDQDTGKLIYKEYEEEKQ